DAPVRRHITFAEFGARFLDNLLTQDLIAAQLRGAIPARIYIDESTPLPAEGRVSFVGIGEISRELRDDEIALTVQIQLSLDVTLPTGPLQTVAVVLPLQLDFRTYDTLILFADAH